MTRPVRVAVQIQPGGTPDYATWRDAVLAADDLGVDVIFGYDHFHRPAMKGIVDGKPVSMGMVDLQSTGGWQSLPYFDNSAALAISQETSPTGNPMATASAQ